MTIATQAGSDTGLAGFEEFLGEVLSAWTLPGLAVSVARDGRVIYERGFGQRDVARGLPVTPQTLFPIASCTKAFTAMGLALLVDEGKLEWDTPVKTYLPALRLYDPMATERLTPRDLLTHRAGLPRHDLMWYGSMATRRDLVERLRYLEPNKDLRALWQYNNLMYMLAGYLIEVVSGSTWEDFLQARLFTPLGMTRSTFSIGEAQDDPDVSRPYKEEKDQAHELPYYAAQGAVGPAGSIVSCLADLGRWLSLQLNKGLHDGTRIISEAQLRQMHAPQMVMPDPGRFSELSLPSYGLGWFIEAYRGHTVIHHGGNIDGFSLMIAFLPRENIGAVVLTNLQGTRVRDLVPYNIFDRLLGLDRAPWHTRFLQERTEFRQALEQGKEKGAADRVEGTSPSHPLDAYMGEFRHPGYGGVIIGQAEEHLTITFNRFSGPLQHYHYDIFEYDFELADMPVKVSFATSVRGDIASLSMALEPSVSDIVFGRVPDQSMSDPRFLEQFAGAYELLDMALLVTLHEDGTFAVTMPDGQEYALVPYKGTEFQIKGLSGCTLEFRRDNAGTVAAAAFSQPGSVLMARRKV